MCNLHEPSGENTISIIALCISIIAILWNIIVYILSVNSRLLVKINRREGAGNGHSFEIKIINVKFRDRTIKDIRKQIKPRKLKQIIKAYFEKVSLQLIFSNDINIQKDCVIGKKVQGDGGTVETNIFISEEYYQKFINEGKKIRVIIIDTYGKRHHSKWMTF